MQLNQLAWKNIWRHRRRTFITALSIGFGIFLATTFTGTGDYMYTNMIDTSATMGFGHVTLEAKGYHAAPTLERRISSAPQLRAQIASLAGIDSMSTRIIGQAMFSSASKSVGGSFMAIDAAEESSAINLLIRSITEGELFTHPNDRQVVIGALMAEKLNLRLGKKLVYTTTDINGEIVGDVARISAIFTTGLDEVDGGMVLLPIDLVRATLGYQADEASMITVIIKDQRYAKEVRDQIAARITDPNVETLSWHQTQGDLTALITLDRTSNYLSQLLVGLIIAAGILNTLLMSVMERSREFGVMMAIGMDPTTLFRLVLLESFWLAIIGTLLGVLLTAPWFWYLTTTGLDFSGMVGEEGYSAGGVLIDPVIHIRLFGSSIVAILSGVFGLTLLSGLYPAWRAISTPPIDSIKTL